PPGSRFKYSNVGYSLLAAIVEIASGGPYEKYLRRTCWLPAGMEHTGYVSPGWDKSLLAHAYRKDETDWGTPLDHLWDNDGPYWNLKGNGGILSTMDDMYRWTQALQGDKILPEEWKKKLYTPHMAEGPAAKSHYGYGWAIAKTSRGTRLIAHNGGND